VYTGARSGEDGLVDLGDAIWQQLEDAAATRAGVNASEQRERVLSAQRAGWSASDAPEQHEARRREASGVVLDPAEGSPYRRQLAGSRL
jgi:hypothetical protein